MPKKTLKNVTPDSGLQTPSTALVINRTEIAAGDHTQIGAQLTALYRQAQDAEVAIIRFGAAFWLVENMLATEDTEKKSGTRAGLSVKRGYVGLATWLREFAPDISERTARRYRDLAEALSEKFHLGNPEVTMRLFDADLQSLPEADQKKREKVRDFVSGQSVRAMQMELGLTSAPTPRNVDPDTGKRLHYPSKKTKEQLQKERLALAHADALDVFNKFSGLGDKWMACDDGELIVALEFWTKWAKKVNRWLNTPPMRRAKFADVAVGDDTGTGGTGETGGTDASAGDDAGEGGAE
ncbi:MAG: hypothetical protein LBK99_23870 [Opitutaceae bacterium]|jgi:hypothetical protein|nr:hypothetical protein [Opitutaceae bacterium]